MIVIKTNANVRMTAELTMEEAHSFFSSHRDRQNIQIESFPGRIFQIKEIRPVGKRESLQWYMELYQVGTTQEVLSGQSELDSSA